MKPIGALLTAAALFCLPAPAQTALPAFEVASVKLLADFEPGLASEKIVAHPGTLTMRSVRLRACIKWAYDVKDYQISGPSWLGSPGWMGRDVERYEVQAKAPEGTPIPEMKRMMQRLLAERFKLVLHRESKEIPAMVLTSVDPRGLKQSTDADPERSIGASPHGALAFRNSTMVEFADFMSGPLGIPILDRTGLSGRFDFTLESPRSGSPEETTSAFPDVLRAQLGLDLKRQRSAIEFLIVDSADHKPTAN